MHDPLARDAGLSDDVLEAMRARKKPAFSRPDEALVFDATTELMGNRVLSTATYDQLIQKFGLDLTLEIVARRASTA